MEGYDCLDKMDRTVTVCRSQRYQVADTSTDNNGRK